MHAAPDYRRRWTGAAALVFAVLTLVAAETIFRGRVGPLFMLLIYGICLLFVCIAVIIALVDARTVARRGLDERRKLVNQALTNIETDVKDRHPPGES